MNDFNCYIKRYEGKQIFEKDGLRFANSAILHIEIDGEDLYDLEYFDGAIVVPDELIKSAGTSGCYLIFTSLNGYADEECRDGVLVSHEADYVKWRFEAGHRDYTYYFSPQQYQHVLADIAAQIQVLDLTLEPTAVIFPESWSRYQF